MYNNSPGIWKRSSESHSKENKTDSENKRKRKNPIWLSQKSIIGHNILYIKESNKEMQKEFLKCVFEKQIILVAAKLSKII